jgi:predicted RNase H-like nuclease (RuvC/YqgF family)
VRDKNSDKFEAALEGKKVPLVTLDNKWYTLFDGNLKTFTMTNLEKKLNKLLGRQGQLYHELKEMEAAKQKLIDKILENMDAAEDEINGNFKSKKLSASQKLIRDLNNKIVNSEKELEELPDLIDKTNKMLLIEGMRICYNTMRSNKKSIEEIDAWIESVRIELKKTVIRKQEIQEESNQMYSYMHDILGFEIVDLFDMYNEALPKE